MSSLLIVLVVGLAGWGLYTASQPRAAFVIRIEDGRPRAARGKVARGFLRDVGDACERHEVRRGTIAGIAQGRQIHLRFSGPIPPGCRQQLRNVWNIHRWPAGSSSPRRFR
ncbi:MAG: DUF3634 family protein [Isosphaeraceae bacterium]